MADAIWTRTDDERAWVYGWGVFDVDSGGAGFLEIQRCDDPPPDMEIEEGEELPEPVFDTDAEALAHVEAMARKFPGEWHARALAWIAHCNQGKTRPVV